MKKNLPIYILLLICIVIQLIFMKKFNVFPDLVLLLVVFSGIFVPTLNAVLFGFAAGLLRGSFSYATFSLDIFLFPLLVILSAVLSKTLYRYNPAIQVFITLTAMITAIAVHTIYLDNAYGNDVDFLSLISGSWKTIMVTAFIAPIAFGLFRIVLKMDY